MCTARKAIISSDKTLLGPERTVDPRLRSSHSIRCFPFPLYRMSNEEYNA